MYNMYEILKELCSSRGITITDMCRAANVPRSSVGNLATGKTQQLSAKNMQKIASYFNVSTDYLLGNEKQKTPATDSDGLTEQDKKDIAVELEQLMQEMQNSGDLMFDGEPATPEAMESLRQAMQLGLTYAKKINKGK
jgi:transcriptional regulator with XRE-family HTH domain